MKQKLFSGAILTLGLLLLAGSFASAQTQTVVAPLTVAIVNDASVDITVFDTNKNRVVGIDVMIYSGDGTVVAKGETKAEGFFNAQLSTAQNPFIVVVGGNSKDYQGQKAQVTVHPGGENFVNVTVTKRDIGTPSNPRSAHVVISVKDAVTQKGIEKARLVLQSNNERFDAETGFTGPEGNYDTNVAANTAYVVVTTAPGYFPNKTPLSVTTEGKVTILLTQQKNRQICREEFDGFKSSDQVKALQAKLKANGYNVPTVSGYNGEYTKKAVEEAKLNGDYDFCYKLVPPTSPPQPVPPTTPPTQLPSSDVKVELSRIAQMLQEVTKALQALLTKLGS